MSRLNDAFDAIELALGELSEAIATSKAQSQTETSSETSSGTPSGTSDLDEAEIQAIRAELGEAVQLLESMKDSGKDFGQDFGQEPETEASS